METYQSLFQNYIGSVEKKVGLSIDEIRSVTPEDMTEYLGKKNGKRIKIDYASRCSAITRDEINAQLDAALGLTHQNF